MISPLKTALTFEWNGWLKKARATQAPVSNRLTTQSMIFIPLGCLLKRN
jgi:hypothetical protein